MKLKHCILPLQAAILPLLGAAHIYASEPGSDNTSDSLRRTGAQYAARPATVQMNQDYFKKNLYSDVLTGWNFRHTHGIVDRDFNNNYEAGGGWLTNIEEFYNPDGSVRNPSAVPGADIGVELPNFSYDAPVNNQIITELDKGVVRQPTTTQVHDVYVIPGERVDLYPYSDIFRIYAYTEDFYRYYNYKTDKAHDDVYFLYRPEDATYNDYGLYSGRALRVFPEFEEKGIFKWHSTHSFSGGIASFYRKRTHNTLDAEPIIDEYISADFSQFYFKDGEISTRAKDLERILDKNTKTINEPIINFRHIFHVTDGRRQADEMFKDKETNEKYVREHRRRISTIAGKDFSIRLLSPLPKDDGVKLNYYYRKNDGTYTRMGRYEIHTYTYDSSTGETGNRDLGYFTPDEHSAYNVANINLRTELNPGGAEDSNSAWLRPNKTFYRAITCNARNAREGKYLVRLIAKDLDGKGITYPDGSPMVVREIIVTFLGNEDASLKLETEIPEKHKEQYLDANFPAKSVQDFDKYMAFEGTDFLDSVTENGDTHSRLKYPAPWMNSSYSFGYKYWQDFATYMIANHASRVPYKQAAIKTPEGSHDRLWNNTKGEKHGFFFYANAAGDPGNMAHVDIPAVCVGSTLHISAWINSMSIFNDNQYTANEPANVIFNLIALMKDGREIGINSFATGYVHERTQPSTEKYGGKWMHAYFRATPDFAALEKEKGLRLADVEKFQIILENNSLNSDGADYAIDDIRIYVAKPTVSAEQPKPICGGETQTTARIDMDFSNLLSSIGKEEASTPDKGERVTIWYTIFDKEKYETMTSAPGPDGTTPTGYTEEVFENASLRYKYNDETANYGSLSFSTHYASNAAEWSYDLPANTAARREVDGLRNLSFNIRPEDETMAPGKVYVAAIAIINNDTPDWTDFDISNICTKQSEFTVRGSNIIKIDGIVKSDAADESVCENTHPVIKLEIYGIEADLGGDGEENRTLIDKNPLIDWYKGSRAEFAAAEHGGVELDKALAAFRLLYPAAVTLDNPFSGDFQPSQKDCIIHFMEEGKLVFATHSLVTDSFDIPEGETSASFVITAIPANREEEREIEGKTYLVCNDPSEVRFSIDRRAPGMLDGFREVIYPEDLRDVPVRVGLSQIEKRKLVVPLRDIRPATSGVAELTRGEDISIYLAQTNDPAYPDVELSVPAGNRPEGNGLRPVGEVTEITAPANENSPAYATLSFNIPERNGIEFHEGYYYTFRFDYSEKRGEDTGEYSEICDGQALFTIRVVAEYQMWTGGNSLNWNNDANWRRVSAEELSTDYAADLHGKVTDAAAGNGNLFSFSPLSFTKVIIPPGSGYPHMFGPKMSDVYTSHDGHQSISFSHPIELSETDLSAGNATKYIEYDLTVEESEGTLYCRPWYANTCGEIHFLANAEIMNQQHVVYRRAWADMEMKPERWYTAASPLQAVVAGDMYLPTDGARQNTRLFTDISFNKENGSNDRFRPAVYQRGWDKGSATVYELPSATAGETRNVAVTLDWSDVYNDVQERYSAGLGYSIKTDVSEITGTTPEYVKFRLPKNDASYEYWDYGGSDHGTENGADIPRGSAYRLNPVDTTVTLKNVSGAYFLAGNPFMAHIDMKKFLKANEEVITPKYWVMTGNSQMCAVFDPESDGFTGADTSDDGTDYTFLPPMQGFFVERKNADATRAAENEELTLKFTADMLAVRPWTENDGILLRTATRSASPAGMTVTACDASEGFEDGSKAFVALSGTADRGYDPAEDAVLLSDLGAERAQVFTVSGNRALAVNATSDAEGTEIGVLAPKNAVTVLRFDNTDAFSHLCLLDSETGESLPLYDGMEYEVTGSASGRLFLTASTSSRPETELLGLRLEVNGNEVKAVAPNATTGIDLHVYDLAGQTVAAVIGCEGEAVVSDLDKGIYILVANASDGSKARRKVLIK